MNTIENYDLNPTTSPSFFVSRTLDCLKKNGIVDFNLSQKKQWNGKELKIPVYGIYKISWGFYQNALDTFYNDKISELSLYVNKKKIPNSAIINKNTPSMYAKKSCETSTTILLKENDTITLKAKIGGIENPTITDLHFKIHKL